MRGDDRARTWPDRPRTHPGHDVQGGEVVASRESQGGGRHCHGVMRRLGGSKQLQLFAAGFTEANQGIDHVALENALDRAKSLVWGEIRGQDESRNFVCAIDDLRRGHDTHLGDDGE